MDLKTIISKAILSVVGEEKCEDGLHCPTRISSSRAPAPAVPLPAFAVPVNIGVANAPGVAATIVRSDHEHNHPAGLGANLHHTPTNDTRDSTVEVAANDSVDITLADAAYRCDGTADETEINTALGVLL